MPTVKRRKQGKVGLTTAQFWYLWLGGDPGAFASERAARQAWLANRDELLTAGNAGTRPEGWWMFEAPAAVKLARDMYEHEYQCLVAHNVVTEAELAQLRAWKFIE